jgi:hypothetical protein
MYGSRTRIKLHLFVIMCSITGYRGSKAVGSEHQQKLRGFRSILRVLYRRKLK